MFIRRNKIRQFFEIIEGGRAYLVEVSHDLSINKGSIFVWDKSGEVVNDELIKDNFIKEYEKLETIGLTGL